MWYYFYDNQVEISKRYHKEAAITIFQKCIFNILLKQFNKLIGWLST